WRSERGVISVDKPGQVNGPRVLITDRSPEIAADLPLVADTGAQCPRVLEVLVEHKHARMIHGTGRDIVRKLGIECRYRGEEAGDRKSTRLNSSHVAISYAVF